MAERLSHNFGVLALLLSTALVASAADQSSTISGTVRDTHGVPQIGALIEIVSSDTIIRATAFTDPQGRYLIHRVLPGMYGVRASAALFVPASRNNLRLQPHRQAVVNITLSGLLDQFSWLPARPKAADESSDDWNWTLRSSASRPMLKLADDGISGEPHNREVHSSSPFISSRAALRSGSRTFGDSVKRVSVRSARVQSNGSRLAISASLGSADPSISGRPASRLSALVERRLPSGGSVAGRVEYQSHPEIVGANHFSLNTVTISSAEKFRVGDFAEVEAGNQLQAISGPVSLIASRPFLHISAHAGPAVAVTYNLATCRAEGDYDSAIWREPGITPAGYLNGHMALENGHHQKISVSRRTRATMLALALYADALDSVAISGGNLASNSPLLPALSGLMTPENLLLDRGNGSFQTLTKGYSTSGVNILFTRALGDNTWVALQYSTGSAMAVVDTPFRNLQSDIPALHARRAQSATVSLRASIARTSTKVRASYRWQPALLVTSVDPYDVLGSGDYLSFHLRQPIHLPRLPEGVELTIDGTNIFAQGYEQFASQNVRPLYLAATPASLQAGLAFSF